MNLSYFTNELETIDAAIVTFLNQGCWSACWPSYTMADLRFFIETLQSFVHYREQAWDRFTVAGLASAGGIAFSREAAAFYRQIQAVQVAAGFALRVEHATLFFHNVEVPREIRSQIPCAFSLALDNISRDIEAYQPQERWRGASSATKRQGQTALRALIGRLRQLLANNDLHGFAQAAMNEQILQNNITGFTQLSALYKSIRAVQDLAQGANLHLSQWRTYVYVNEGRAILDLPVANAYMQNNSPSVAHAIISLPPSDPSASPTGSLQAQVVPPGRDLRTVTGRVTPMPLSL